MKAQIKSSSSYSEHVRNHEITKLTFLWDTLSTFHPGSIQETELLLKTRYPYIRIPN